MAARFALLVLALLIAVPAAACGGGEDSGEGPLRNPRTVHLLPDGRLLVADAGTGKDDGRVLAMSFDLSQSTGEELVVTSTLVLMKGLKSRKSASRFGGLGGPNAAGIGPDGVICALIGYAERASTGHATMTCTDGTTASFLRVEETFNPDGGPIASDPYDMVPDGRGGWYVSDPAANAVYTVDDRGNVDLVAALGKQRNLEGADGQPMGLFILTTGRAPLLGAALAGGGIAGLAPSVRGQAPVVIPLSGIPIALVDDGKQETFTLIYSDRLGGAKTGAILDVAGQPIVTGLDRPTGFVRLPDGRFIVVESGLARLRLVKGK
jgi:hypothetical protein